MLFARAVVLNEEDFLALLIPNDDALAVHVVGKLFGNEPRAQTVQERAVLVDQIEKEGCRMVAIALPHDLQTRTGPNSKVRYERSNARVRRPFTIDHRQFVQSRTSLINEHTC